MQYEVIQISFDVGQGPPASGGGVGEEPRRVRFKNYLLPFRVILKCFLLIEKAFPPISHSIEVPTLGHRAIYVKMSKWNIDFRGSIN